MTDIKALQTELAHYRLQKDQDGIERTEELLSKAARACARVPGKQESIERRPAPDTNAETR